MPHKLTIPTTKEFKILKEVANELGADKFNIRRSEFEGKYKGYNLIVEYVVKECDDDKYKTNIELYPLCCFTIIIENKSKDAIKKEIVDKLEDYIDREKPTTASNKFSYKGRVINAASKEEAISKIIASSEPTIDGNLSALSNDIIKQVSEFSTELQSVIKKLRELERARKCSWHVDAIQKTAGVFSYKFWVVNNKEEHRDYILSLDNGLLSEFKAFNVKEPSQNLKGSVVRDIENFVG